MELALQRKWHKRRCFRDNHGEYAAIISSVVQGLKVPALYREDVAAHLWLTLWEEWERFDSRRSSFKTFVSRVLRWRAIDEMRRLTNYCRGSKQSRSPALFSSQPQAKGDEDLYDCADTSPMVDEQVELSEFVRTVRGYAQGMGQLQLAIFDRTLMRDGELSEIAAQFGVSVSWCCRCRQQMLAKIRASSACCEIADFDTLVR